MIRLILLAWAALFLLVGAVRADQTEVALTVMCGARGATLVQMVRAEARRHLMHPLLLASVIAAESRCRAYASSGRGDFGLGQIRLGGSAARGATVAELLEPARNVELTARHLASCLMLCGFTSGALSVYSGRKHCRPSKYSERVLGLFRLSLTQPRR